MCSLTKHISINDSHCKGKVEYVAEDIFRQKVYGISLLYEDLNDCATLREDTAISCLAYTLTEAIRRLALKNTGL